MAKIRKRNTKLHSTESEDTASLEYSSTSDSSIESTKLRPSTTIKKNSEVEEIKSCQGSRNTSMHETRFTQMKLKSQTETNVPFGDDIHEQTDDQTILFHNINGIKDSTNWFQIITTMRELNVDVFGFAEINQQMARGKGRWTETIRKIFQYSRNIHSESSVVTDYNYKPGGTMTVITGKWQSRVTEMGSDPKGLGRWSYIKISSRKKNLIIITAYRPCASRGINTAWMQQWSIIREAGETNPDPIALFYSDLDSQLQKWKEMNYEMIMLIDANERIGEKPGGLTAVMGRAGLIDLVRYCHPNDDEINTHTRGSKQIDFILGTRGVSNVCNRAGILPFGIGYMSDHRAIFIKINIEKLLSAQINSIDSITARKLTQATPKERKIFLEEVHLHWVNQNLYERLKKLAEVPQHEWDERNSDEYEHCDKQMVQGMLSAEKKARKVKVVPWSPIFAKAVNSKAFWKIALQLKTMHRMPSEKFLAWAATLGISDFKSIDTNTVKKNLRKAQKEVRAIEQKANALREEHLRNLLTEAELNCSETDVQKRLKILIRAQRQRHHFQRLKSIFKPKSAGGLTYILVPENFDPIAYPYDPNDVEAWEALHDQSAVQNYIQKRNITHFGQAHGSPFTVSPLNSINWQADSIQAREMIAGSIPIDFLEGNQQIERVLKYIANRAQLPEIDTHITKEQVCKGFRRWRENTSTSPSGCHLGLRRIATYPIIEDEAMESIRQQVLQVQTDVINLPIQNGFSPKRWQTVTNAMLEKIPGKPFLHKLRVIHILEADYNLALKQIFGKRLLKNCETTEALGDLQDGFRKGRSTIRTLLHNEIICDYNKRLRINNFIGMTDISGCFDRILAPVISLLNIKNGCPTQAVKMHATTLQKARYHLKTKLGVTENFYSHSESTPVYGNGQGAGDSPSQWCQQSAMLFELYGKENEGATVSDRWGHTRVTLPLAAFADDTNLLGNDEKREMTMESLTASAQKGFTIWNEILHATGHFMELEKCSCYLSIWDFEEDGYAYTLSPKEHNQHILVQDMNGSVKEIPQLTAEQSQKLLGVMRNPIGNQQDEIYRLQQKSNRLATLINLNALSATEAKMAYESFYIPAMRYSLPVTSINQMDFETIQQKATTAILATMGYNRHMPREVVFGSSLHQGLNLRHLYDIQGMESTRLLLQELNSQNTTSEMIRCLIDVIQLEAGIGQPVLEDTRPLDYIEWGWIPSIRDYLHHIRAKIINVSSAPKTYRTGDSYIMDNAMLKELSRKERILINRCRIYHQVECVSDIATADGVAINREWLSNQKQHRSSSNKVWPAQGDPGIEAWKIWEKFLTRAFTDGSGKLVRQLSSWKSTDHRTHFAYYYKQRLWMYWRDEKWTVHEMRHQGRRELFFKRQHTRTTSDIPQEGVPIDVKSESDEWIITGTAAGREQQIKEFKAVTFQETCMADTKLTNTNLNIVVDEEDLKLTLAQKAIIDMASDGSHDQHTGNLAYGWVMAINGTVIAKGQGRVSCPRAMSGSFRAEAYGLAAVAQFTVALVKFFQLQTDEHQWFIYLDNKTLINKLERYRQEKELSKWNLQPDADLVQHTYKLVRHIPLRLIHVRSHQNSGKKFTDLSLPVQMNTMADQLAREQAKHGTNPPAIYVPFRYLKIKDNHITRDSQQQLMEEAAKIPIQHYYKEKYQWKTATFQMINWQIQRKVLMTYSSNDQRRILKMVHGWLPTYERLHRENQTTNPRCPLCHYRSETSFHIFCCKHPRQREIYKRIINYLEENVGQSGNKRINQILIAVMENANDTMPPHIENTGDNQIDKWIQDQNKIGWNHMFYGRTAKSLEIVMEKFFRNRENDTGQETGSKWVKRLIQKIWDIFLQLWSQRNEIIHGKQEGQRSLREQQFLETRVSRCYEYQYKLRVVDREKIFHKPQEELLREDARYIKAWIKLCERIIRAYKKETEETTSKGRFMENYFKWKPNKGHIRNEPQQQIPHQKHDLRPD